MWDEWVSDRQMIKMTKENFEKYKIEPPKVSYLFILYFLRRTIKTATLTLVNFENRIYTVKDSQEMFQNAFFP